jgi:hypothetical protein
MIKPTNQLISAAADTGWQISFASVSAREAYGPDFESDLKIRKLTPELGVWDESAWDEARWADQPSSERLDRILNIISNESFPKSVSNLTKDQFASTTRCNDFGSTFGSPERCIRISR